MIGWLYVDDGTAHLFGARFSGALDWLPTSRRRFREHGSPLWDLAPVHRVNGRTVGTLGIAFVGFVLVGL